MKIIYRCSQCKKIISYLEVDSFNEESLGLNILTEEEKEDIIEIENNVIYINVDCDDCLYSYDWSDLICNQNIH